MRRMSMGFVLLTMLLDAMTAPGAQQSGSPADQVAWLAANAVPIRSIDPADDDFSDLQPLKAVLANVRVVQLGEDSHGDGASLWAKQRLVRFLHEQMGFDLLAWETRNFFAAEEMNDEFDSGQPIDVGGIWGEGGLTRPIYDYVRATRKTPRPLRFTGVDLFFGSSAPGFGARLFDFLDRYGPGLATAEDRQAIAEFIAILGPPTPVPRFKAWSDEQRARVQGALDRVTDALRQAAAQAQDRRRFFPILRPLEDLASIVPYLRISLTAGMGGPATVAFRGRRMGENLVSLSRDYYPNQKIIVWAASAHIARHISSVDYTPALKPGQPPGEDLLALRSPEYKEMGDFIHDALDDRVYGIRMLAYQGTRALRGQPPRPIEPLAGSLEWMMHDTGRPYAFVDFRSLPTDHWLRTPQLSGFWGIARAVWPEMFDGLFFIDRTFPNTESGEVPAGTRTKRDDTSR